MKTKRMWTMALALAMGVATVPVEAQRGPGVRGRAPGPFVGRSLEMVLEHREDLELTGDQVQALEELKEIHDRNVVPLREEMDALRAQLQEGEVDRADGFRQMEALRGRLITAGAPMRGRVQEILTVAQHRQVLAAVRISRGVGGRAFRGAPGRGVARGQFRGSRGGLNPRQGFQGQGWGRRPGFRGEFRRGSGGLGILPLDEYPDPLFQEVPPTG